MSELRRLKGGKCENCGYSKCDKALEFHHVNEKDKKFNISRRSSKNLKKGWTEFIEEINKCVLLCANCHREAHYGFLDVTKIPIKIVR